jgi:hypothetical protein
MTVFEGILSDEEIMVIILYITSEPAEPLDTLKGKAFP